jgi:hypothetical protein
MLELEPRIASLDCVGLGAFITGVEDALSRGWLPGKIGLFTNISSEAYCEGALTALSCFSITMGYLQRACLAFTRSLKVS